ncbi:MAG: AMP-binding protein, partial [Prochlorococcaceae cyanobacterium]
WQLDQQQVVLAASAFSFDISLRELLFSLSAGCRVVLADEWTRKDPIALVDLIDRHQCTRIQATPSHWRLIMNTGWTPKCSTQVISIGEVLDEELARVLSKQDNISVINLYGTTEAPGSVSMTIHGCQEGPPPIGRPVAGVRVHVLDQSGNPCPIGVPGELHLASQGMAREYLNKPELSSQRFIHDPFTTRQASRLSRTGDLVIWRQDGTLEYRERIDHQIKIRAMRIEPAEIETLLDAQDEIKKSLVMLDQSNPSIPQLVAYWIPSEHHDSRQDFPESLAEIIRSRLAAFLPEYMLPNAFIQLDAFPLTSNGKVARHLLPAPSETNKALNGSLQPPRSALELLLKRLWQIVLGHHEFGIHDNFFQLGGHSLSAARLAQLIEKQLGKSLAVSDIFKAQTIADLAALLGTDDDEEIDLQTLVLLQPEGEKPPLFIIHGWGGSVYAFLNIVKSMPKDRPIYGLQAQGLDQPERRQNTVIEMANHYVQQIRAVYPEGPFHLLAYSCGSSYALGVAEVLHSQGCKIGMLALFDSEGSARIHKRVKLKLASIHLWKFLTKTLERSAEITITNPQRSLSNLRQWKRGAAFRIKRMSRQLMRPIHTQEATRTEQHNQKLDYFASVGAMYRPRRLPIHIDLFCASEAAEERHCLWQFYGTKGVTLHLDYVTDHWDYCRPEPAQSLAHKVCAILERTEAP